MNTENRYPCADCQKAMYFNQLEYLFCGHLNVIAFRQLSGVFAFMPVASTEHAMDYIRQSGLEPRPLAKTA